MKTELQIKLFEKYPKIFKQKDLSIKESCMCWGVECGDGWYWLIDQLCNSLQRYIDSNNKEQIEAVQIKEKYGTLCFYADGIEEFTQGMIWLAESMSGDVCELCGSTNNVTQSTGWIMTRCDKCKNAE